jgi:hypothetical protein
LWLVFAGELEKNLSSEIFFSLSPLALALPRSEEIVKQICSVYFSCTCLCFPADENRKRSPKRQMRKGGKKIVTS